MSHLATGQDNAEAETRGLYLHVPFCAKTCDFCGFYQTTPTAPLIRKFLDGVEKELGILSGRGPVSTVFWGGGTPGLLPPEAIRRLGSLISGFCASAPAEWSVELAPGSVHPERLAALREIGVTRVSLGVQSFSPGLLEAIGRPHTVRQVETVYARIREAGFSSVNLDLMFALPGQTEEARAEDVRRAVSLHPDHLSTYCLTLEEDTALWLRLAKGAGGFSREAEAIHYESTWRQLAECGYEQYEVSNFARPGHRCRHNFNTWRMGSWYGVGPSAASQHDGWRGSNVADLDAWTEGLSRGFRADRDRVATTPELLAQDALVFGLRLNDGVDTGPWRTVSPGVAWKRVDELVGWLKEEGLATRRGDRVWLTERGRLLADAIGVEIMEAFTAEAAPV
jgi:oxygen-independent coproporphyrinogen-3 oxidase